MLDRVESNLSRIMGTYGERLDQAIRNAKKERKDLARALDISVQAVAQVIAGKTKALTADNSARAARFLAVDGFWLATGEGHLQPNDQAAPAAAPWPFKRIDIGRVERLATDELAYVEGKLESVIESVESRTGAAKSKTRKAG